LKLIDRINFFKSLSLLEKSFADRDKRIDDLLEKYPYPREEEEEDK
jgi:hypothetical protein